jgi:hypothetical protein
MKSGDLSMKRRRDQKGVTLVDTALMVALVVVVCMIGVRRVGQKTADNLCRAKRGFDVAGTSAPLSRADLANYYFDKSLGLCNNS